VQGAIDFLAQTFSRGWEPGLRSLADGAEKPGGHEFGSSYASEKLDYLLFITWVLKERFSEY
jgi:hypothetical protein